MREDQIIPNARSIGDMALSSIRLSMGVERELGMSDDFKEDLQGIHYLVKLVGREVVLEGLEKDKRDAEKEVNRLEDAIAELA